MSIWHPIETAPKDGTQLLLWWDSKPVISYYAERTGFKGWQPPSMMPIKVTDRSTWNPTHWMPLPSAPSDPAQEPEAVAWRWQEPGWGDHWVYNPDPSWLEQQNDIVKQPLYTRPVSLDREAALLAICRTMKPNIFRRGLHPLEKDGPATRATIAETVNTATKALDTILTLIEGMT